MKIKQENRKEQIDRQAIANYQYQILQQGFPQLKPNISNTQKYSVWDLDKKIKQLIGQQNYTLRWIGASQISYLEAYACILIIGTGCVEVNMLQFKNIIYKISRKCLQRAQQKLLVEFLYLLEYSRDRNSFLNKYPRTQAVFIKLLEYLEEMHSSSDGSSNAMSNKAKIKRKLNNKNRIRTISKGESSSQKLFQTPGKLQQISQRVEDSQKSCKSSLEELNYERQLQFIYGIFNSYFSNVSLIDSNQFSISLRLFKNKKVFVIIQKGNYFILQSKQTQKQPIIQKQYSFSQYAQLLGLKQLKTPSDKPLSKNFEKQFNDIFNFKCQVEESHVVKVNNAAMKKQKSKNLEHQSSINKNKRQQSIIDALLQSTPDLQKIKQQPKKSKRQQVRKRVAQIGRIKQELKLVQLNIQSKIKILDSNIIKRKEIQKRNQNSLSPTPIQKQRHNQEILYKRNKNRSYKSVDLPIKRYSPTSIDFKDATRYTKPINQFVTRPDISSDKISSRPHSIIRSAEERIGGRYYIGSTTSVEDKSLQIMRPLSPPNFNVNVNLNINESILSPLLTSSHSLSLSPQRMHHKIFNMQSKPIKQRAGNSPTMIHNTNHVNPERNKAKINFTYKK